jgi:hypothetical protein
MVAEIPLAILPAPLRVAATGQPAFVSIDLEKADLEADLGAERQHQDLAGLVAARMTDQAILAVVEVPQKTV